MARPLRLAVPNGIYHVTARGNGKQAIFLSDGDRLTFLDSLRDVEARFGWRFLTYCLMNNHYHLVVRTPRPNLSEGMRQLNGVYAQRFNRVHRTCGHLFQGRFMARLVVEDAHLLEVARYVALNPVRAGLCESPEDWQWSAHAALTRRDGGARVVADELLRMFGSDPRDAHRRYRRFVSEGAGEPPRESDLDAAQAEMLPVKPPSTEIPAAPWHARRPSLREILADPDRDQAISVAYCEHGYRMREIAEALGCHYATVSRRLKAFEARRSPGPQA